MPKKATAKKADPKKNDTKKNAKTAKQSPFSALEKEVKIPGLGVLPVTIHTVRYEEKEFSHTKKIECKQWLKAQKQAARAAKLDPEKIKKQAARALKRSIQVLGEDATNEILQSLA